MPPTKAERASRARLYRAKCRAEGRCCQCLKPVVQFGCCVEHAERKRIYNRAWQRETKDCQPRYATHPEWGYPDHGFLFAGPKPQLYWEQAGGRWWRVSVDRLDPLTILLRREAAGSFVFRRERPLAGLCA